MRRWITGVAILLAAGLAGAGTYLILRPKGPPEAPSGLTAVPDLCIPPQCEAFTPTIELSWTAPATGDPVTGYSILRDGETLTNERIAPGRSSFVDGSVLMDEAYTYQVVATPRAGARPRPTRPRRGSPNHPCGSPSWTAPSRSGAR